MTMTVAIDGGSVYPQRPGCFADIAVHLGQGFADQRVFNRAHGRGARARPLIGLLITPYVSRQMRPADDRPLQRDRPARGQTAQLRDIAGPVITRQPLADIFRERGRPSAGARGLKRHKMFEQTQAVRLPLADGRHIDPDHIEPVKQIRPETALCHGRGEVRTGCRDEPRGRAGLCRQKPRQPGL